jgi:hypothetical protein
MIRFKAIDLIEEVSSDVRQNERVDVLKDEETWGHLPGFEENLANGSFWSLVGEEGFYVQGFDYGRNG